MNGSPCQDGLHARLVSDVPFLDVSVEVATGTTLAVMGPNGSGKTTLLSMIAGALRSGSDSEISLDGRILASRGVWVPPFRRRIAFLAQDPALFPHMTVRANIGFASAARGMSRQQIADRVDYWLAATDIECLADRRPSQLSGGQAQRVAIARALAAEPEALLLDEPFRALDVDVAARIRAMLRRVLGERRQMAMIVTHDVVDAVTLADSLTVLADGRVIESGSVRGLLSSPRTAFTSRLAGLSLIEGVWDGCRLRAGFGCVSGVVDGEITAGDAAIAVFSPSAVSLSVDVLSVDVLSTAAPDDGGVRSVVAAHVVQIEPRDERARVRCVALGADIAADIGWEAVDDLHMVAGMRVYATVAAGDVRVYRTCAGSHTDYGR